MPEPEPDSAAYRVREWMDGRTTVLDPDDVREIHVAAERAVRDLNNSRGELGVVRAELERTRQTVRAEVAAELNALIYHCPTHDTLVAPKLDPACPGCQRHAALIGVAQLVAGHESPNVDAVRGRRLIDSGRDLRIEAADTAERIGTCAATDTTS